MPTYEYACKDCSHQFEIFQSFDEDTLTECPSCHGHLRKKFNSVGVVFKGSGFYRTDSRSSSTATESANSSTGSAPAAAGASGGSSSESTAGAKAASSSGAATAGSATTSA